MNVNILGRENLIEYMKTAALREEFSHAYIFEGEKGMGKLFAAKEFAKLILGCGKETEEEKQIVCRQVDNGNSPDIIYVEPDKPSGISVDEIRTKIVATADVFPYGKYKLYIVKEAEKMTEQAQNAMLKTIEEPPEYVIIILLSANKNRLLPTIRSRCVMLDVKPVDADIIKEYLIDKYNVQREI